MPTTKIRKMVPLDQHELDRVNRFTADELLKAVATRHASGAISSEASLMHTLLVAGMDALEEEADEQRYALYAAQQDDEDRSFKAARLGRRWSSE